MEEKEEKTIAEEFQELEELIAKMESPEVSLEDSFNYYAKGMAALKEVNEKIEGVEKQVQVLNEGRLEPFTEEM